MIFDKNACQPLKNALTMRKMRAIFKSRLFCDSLALRSTFSYTTKVERGGKFGRMGTLRMSFPRKKLDMGLLILEERSCEVIEACAKKFDPEWDFNRFEAIQCNAADALPEDGNRYDASYIFHISGPALDTLDREIPFLFPLERGKHYMWELFTDLPKSGGSRSSRQFWNRLSRAMSKIELPITEDELVSEFEQASLALLNRSVDLGDRFYLPDLDYGGWNGGFVSKDFLIEGLRMLASKLAVASGDRKKTRAAAETDKTDTTAEGGKEDEGLSGQKDRTDL